MRLPWKKKEEEKEVNKGVSLAIFKVLKRAFEDGYGIECYQSNDGDTEEETIIEVSFERNLRKLSKRFAFTDLKNSGEAEGIVNKFFEESKKTFLKRD